MSGYYIGQISTFGFNFAPRFWAQCNGQLLAIAQNQALFSLLGTTYGGNGTTNFQLPDLRSRTPVGIGGPFNNVLGQTGGVETVTLLSTQIPQHVHTVAATTANGTVRNPNNAVYANSGVALFGPSSGSLVPLNPATVANAGGNQPHINLQPYQTINFCIALSGIYPSRN
ncbi:phage tail protein [Arenimonas terrae]|uniref:Phage tail protein n=1 Tax=Arenimonas terrae TaxID=2546226 RepID=A0A5C4RPM5_9GAMM|nr:tail fiber protein [Arenimonas terrae]TNJ32879.1 phage tail protein [Arenimonas terrae]